MRRSVQGESDVRATQIYDSLPNFFIIGAAKAGTTTLYQMLEQHPQIHLPRIKEPHYFSNDLVYQEGLDWYVRTHYESAASFAARGDATPHYIFYEKAAARIASDLPRSHHRFIVVLRNPVDRAYSLYWNMVYEGHEEESFEDALRLENSRDFTDLEKIGTVRQQYLSSGLYAAQLSIWLRYFNRTRFLFLLSDDLARFPDASLAKVLDFLELDPARPAPSLQHANSASQPRSRLLQNYLRRPSRLRSRLGKFVPFRAKRALVTAVLSMNRRKYSYPPMKPETRQALLEYFRSDIEQLEQLTGSNVTRWLASGVKESSA